MSHKQSKRLRRIVKKQKGEILKDLVSTVKDQSFMDRLRIAWSIVRGK